MWPAVTKVANMAMYILIQAFNKPSLRDHKVCCAYHWRYGGE